MSQPARRKSILAGSTPVAPAPAADPAVQAPAEPPKRKTLPKVGFYQDPADTARVRAAYLHTITSEGNRSLSDFIAKAVMTEVRRLEVLYNDGQPFPAVGVREVPQGRPVGEG